MSLKPQTNIPIPPETARVAEAAFPKRNGYMRMRDVFGSLYSDDTFAGLFPERGQPAESPAHLALITVMQFAEGLSDRQAADAVRSRIDWKYALGLELTDPGFDASVLSEFRTRLIAGGSERVLFDTLLIRLRDAGLVKARGPQRTDSTHVLAAIHTLNRLELVGETLRHALNTLAVVEPDWLRNHVPTEWFDRYGSRFEDYRLPTRGPEQTALFETIGADGMRLLAALYATDAPVWWRHIPAVEVLRRVWVQQLSISNDGVQMRHAGNLPPAGLMICSPYDAEARYSQKRQTEWIGYKVHLTETCEADTPNVVTDVQTTPAPQADFGMLPTIQADLATRDLLPQDHLVDAGYVTAEQIVMSQRDHQITVVGPVHPDPSWQAKAQAGFDVAAFAMDWEAQTATCPQGRRSTVWIPGHDQHGKDVFHIRFRKQDCLSCPVREHCTHASSEPRKLTIRTREFHQALQMARDTQDTVEFKDSYAARAGIEGSLSQGIRASGLRRCRYIGLAKTRLQHLIIGAALNLRRVGAWLADLPRAQTRRSPFAALALAAA